MTSAALADLAAAIEAVEIPGDGVTVGEALHLVDRLTAKVSAAVGEFDAEGLWGLDGATSLQAWLRYHGSLAGADAHRLAKGARRLHSCRATRRAWLDGRLSGGQVRAITGNVTDRTAGLYAEHEGELVPALEGLTPAETATAMRDWAARADAVVDPDTEPEPPPRSLHMSRTLAGRWELRGSLDAEAGEVVATALRLAESSGDDAVEGGRVRLAAERRGDALVDLCRWFLDNQEGRRGGRRRPHVNVVIDVDDLVGRGPARLLDGTPLDVATTRRLLCDAGFHRVLVAGRSTILDYGRTTRSVSPELWAALVIRDGGCRIPWCDRDASWCDAHHIQPWEEGGTTDQANLVLLCAWHHHQLHKAGWRLKLLPDATVEVTDPAGRTHTATAPARGWSP